MADILKFFMTRSFFEKYKSNFMFPSLFEWFLHLSALLTPKAHTSLSLHAELEEITEKKLKTQVSLKKSPSRAGTGWSRSIRVELVELSDEVRVHNVEGGDPGAILKTMTQPNFGTLWRREDRSWWKPYVSFFRANSNVSFFNVSFIIYHHCSNPEVLGVLK